MCIEEEYSDICSRYFDNDYDLLQSDEEISYSDNNRNTIHSCTEEEELEETFFGINYSGLNLSSIDLNENEIAQNFYSTNCCVRKCNELIPKHLVIATRNNCLEMSKQELDLVVLGYIESGRMCKDELQEVYKVHVISNKSKYARREDSENPRSGIQFRYYNVPVCRTFFLFAHACGRGRFDNLVKHFDSDGVTTRVHKLTNKACTNPAAFTKADIEKVIKFIQCTADALAIPLPGRLPQFKDYRVMKLPSSETKSSIYRKYIDSLDDDELKMSNRSFRRIWNKYIPYVTIMKPADDLCDVCRGK